MSALRPTASPPVLTGNRGAQMATAAQAQATPTTTDPIENWLARRGACPQLDAEQIGSPAPSSRATHPETRRASVNRANSQHSTGPRTESGKQRSSLNALRHGLTAQTAVLPTEDPETYQRHIQQFLDEYQPATPTETQLVHEIANTAWRLNRIPFLEAELLSQNPSPQTLIRSSPRSACTARASPASFKKPSISSATSRKSAAAWSADSSPKRPNSSCAISTKDFPGTPPTFFQTQAHRRLVPLCAIKKVASFFQRNKSSATHNT
jgi:hypothetical protein